jgi:hypothetical protein
MEVEQMKWQDLKERLKLKRWNAGRVAPWFLLLLIPVGLVKEAEFSVAWMLVVILMGAVVDICHYRGELAVLCYWCAYTAGAGIAFAIGACMLGEWILGACCCVAACTVALQARRIWKEI